MDLIVHLLPTGTIVIGGGLGVSKNIYTNEGITLPSINSASSALLSNYEVYKHNTQLIGPYATPIAIEFLLPLWEKL